MDYFLIYGAKDLYIDIRVVYIYVVCVIMLFVQSTVIY